MRFIEGEGRSERLRIETGKKERREKKDRSRKMLPALLTA